MYFSNFPKIVYDFDLPNGVDYKIVTDITRNVRLRKQILENILVYDYYDIGEGETPEIISEKIYGTPYYHWVIMLVNQRYDYINDFPLTQLELDTHIEGGGIGMMAEGKVLESVVNEYQARIDNILVASNSITVQIEVSLRHGKFQPNETVTILGENTFAEVVSCTVPAQYTITTNYDYEFALNESKRRIKIVDPALVEQLVKEFKDII